MRVLDTSSANIPSSNRLNLPLEPVPSSFSLYKSRDGTSVHAWRIDNCVYRKCNYAKRDLSWTYITLSHLMGPIETCNSIAKHAVLCALIHSWGLEPLETCSSRDKHTVLCAQIHRWGLGPIETCYSGAKHEVLSIARGFANKFLLRNFWCRKKLHSIIIPYSRKIWRGLKFGDLAVETRTAKFNSANIMSWCHWRCGLGTISHLSEDY